MLKAIHDQRPDLAAEYDLANPQDRARYITWCLTSGRNDYSAIMDLARADQFPGLHDADPTMRADTPIPVSGLMRIAWLARDDVREAFSLPESADEFVWWFFLHGARELALDDLVSDHTRDAVNAPVMPPDSPHLPPLTRVMQRIWQTRPDLREAFDLRDEQARHAFIRWFLITGIEDHDLAWLVDPAQLAWRQAPWFGLPQATNSGISNLMGETWAGDPALKEMFDLSSQKGARGLVDWWRQNGKPTSTSGHGSCWENAAIHHEGIDLFGYTRGELGIGEDVRMLSRALASAGVPHAAIDVKPDPIVRQADQTLEARLVERPEHRAAIFAMTGVETVRVIATRGLNELRDRYIIGNWPWELPRWPARWAESYDLVDEIWAPSQFIHDAFAESTPVPVLHMPYPVEIPKEYRRWRRQDFGLPESRFLFHFSFDFLSYPHRKNPWACINAFQRAFDTGREPVGLVVKTMRAHRRSPAWRRLQAMALDDPRIVLINQTMSRDQVIGLMAVTDAYVSLHRSEGFGRGMAEAMLLERPVIATNYSGNTDFLSRETGFPVDFRMVSVRPGHYPGAKGQHWADADVEHASQQMRRVFEDGETA